MKKESDKGKKIKIGIIVLLSIFILWNILWLNFSVIKYKSYTKKIPKEKCGAYVIKDKEDYCYSVHFPGYLRFTGNLAIDHSDSKYCLIIWPKINGKYDYGIRIKDESDVYEIMINKNGEAIKDKNESDLEFKETKQILNKHESNIKNILLKANNFWDLN